MTQSSINFFYNLQLVEQDFSYIIGSIEVGPIIYKM